MRRFLARFSEPVFLQGTMGSNPTRSASNIKDLGAFAKLVICSQNLLRVTLGVTNHRARPAVPAGESDVADGGWSRVACKASQ